MRNLSDTLIQTAVELTLIPGTGARTRNRIWKVLSDSADLSSIGGDTLKCLGVTGEAYHAIQSRVCKAAAMKIFDRACRLGCRFLVQGGAGYPTMLEEIYDAPLLLYVRGLLEQADAPGIAVVGSRRPTVYGLQTARDIAQDLGSRGLCIVSGLARGIDAAAHRGCMEGGGGTLAVLGCGIDVDYPREHRQLKETIFSTGLVLSEYPPGTPPVPRNFPVRNRIISGLSLGTVIVEANEKSGSLITARLAMEQNREVFAVPGKITSPASYGTNFLIKQGAKLIQSYRDVIDELPAVLQKKIYSSDKAEKERRLELDPVSEEEKRILLFLKLDEAIHFDQLYHNANVDIGDLSEKLINLELAGRIRRLPGDMYVRAERLPEE